MRRLVAVALVTIACGAAAAHAQTLSLSFAKGEVYHYTLHVTSNETIAFGAMTVPYHMDMTADEALTVESIDSSGVAHVSLTLSNVNLKMSTTTGGSSTSTTITKFPLPAQEFTIGPDGRVTSVNGVSISGLAQYGLVGSGYLSSAVLPDSAVKPNDTWSKTFDQAIPGGTGTIHITAKSTYLRDEKLKSVNAAVVETTSTETIEVDVSVGGPPMNPIVPTGGQNSPSPSLGLPFAGIGQMTIKGTVSSDTTTWIDPGSHRILRSRMSSRNDLMMSIAIPHMPPGTAANPPSQFPLSGEITMRGSQTLDQEPA